MSDSAIKELFHVEYSQSTVSIILKLAKLHNSSPSEVIADLVKKAGKEYGLIEARD